MTTEQKIEAIKEAIEKAKNHQSKLTSENMAVPGLVSILGRHLYNNLGAISTRFCEVGSHLGCSYTSSVSGNGNLLTATAIDSFASDLIEERQCMPIFLGNVEKFTPKETKFKFIHSDAFSFDVNEIQGPIDYYIYDGGHAKIQQKMGVAYYLPVMADQFIMVIDDFDWVEVHEGTREGIQESGLKILYENVLVGNDHDNDGAWNGYGIFLLEKQ